MVKKVCDACGKVFDVWDEEQGFHIEHTVGYGSKFDGDTLSLDLCNECLDKVLDYISALREKHEEETEEDDDFEQLAIGGSTDDDDDDIVWKAKNPWPKKWS